MRLINADALIRAVEGNPHITDSIKSYVRVSVSKQPTIEERKKGKWIRKTSEDWWCNQCGNEICTETPENYYYCPNCGADMRGDKRCATE